MKFHTESKNKIFTRQAFAVNFFLAGSQDHVR
jgi:hypothetical protein